MQEFSSEEEVEKEMVSSREIRDILAKWQEVSDLVAETRGKTEE